MSSTRKRGADAYRDAGVDYAVLDAGKRMALNLAQATSEQIAHRGGMVREESRGSSAFVFDAGDQTLALVMEGLGTKSIIARLVADQGGGNHFRAVAYDAVAAILNDLCCVGARPLVLNAYFATGTPEWFTKNEEWYEQLLEGWFAACVDAGCTWGGGESPSLPELVTAEDIELAGSAVGDIPSGREPILGQDLAAGDEIVLVESNGLHANGSSLARLIVGGLPNGFATPIANGETFGAALLKPSYLYSELVERLLDNELPVTYLSHITGHGLLKLMRPAKDFTYRITKLLPPSPVFEFMVDKADMTMEAAYSTFNMGCGFAIYCAKGSGQQVVESASRQKLKAIVAGTVEEGDRKVIIEPHGLEFSGDQLRLAPEEE